MTLSEAAREIGASWRGADREFSGVSIDTRTLARGDLFVAIRGERFDGHAFVLDALGRGAAGAMVEGGSSESARDDSPLLVVDDTRLALGQLAAAWRNRFALAVVALTGSSGKTTVKEMLAAILREASGEDQVLATQGNLNNDLGVPLTLLKLRLSHRYGVIEMGMNHPGEIAYCARIARAGVALVTNAQPAHLQGLGSIEAVARAKGEIFEPLPADGVAVINADDPHAPLWRSLANGRRIVEFGLDHPASVSARYGLEAEATTLNLNTPSGEIETRLRVPGLHNVRNALAAVCAADVLEISTGAIGRGLAAFTGIKGRLQRKAGLKGATLIDDTYNANPASVAAAIAVLAKASGKKGLVLGDLGELGAQGELHHREIGAVAKRAGLDFLYTLGRLSAQSAAEFGPGARHFERIEDLITQLEEALAPHLTLLIKGSRFMQMERVVKALEKGQ
ncbi:MAG TPA: UDP-N-acetylmuramoyl-tripeptide--D-alanyl-D-alanine ligase [Burkholderiales bacterium]|nr:UDP-N-acetylmuramoyl-tripeptide--D-alanyl-D-alanine ligase [Burkholderiales bacterium]